VRWCARLCGGHEVPLRGPGLGGRLPRNPAGANLSLPPPSIASLMKLRYIYDALKRNNRKAVSMQLVAYIGEKLKKIRLRRAMSQRKLADTAGISQRAIVDLEADRTEPRPSTLGKLAEALRVDPGEFLENC
jgi:DNA-binding XRE family transcriptional regulator